MKTKVKTRNRVLSMLLLGCLVFSELSCVASVKAEETVYEDSQEQQSTQEEQELQTDISSVGKNSQGEAISEDNVPAAVGYEEAVLKNHIERMFEEEMDNLHCVIFKNADETRTQYLFDYPVK